MAASKKVGKPHLRGRAQLEIKKSKDGQFYFVLVAANGEPILTSETYTRRADAERGARTMRDLAGCASIVHIE
jgi:uncharacterized protein YegP (UPF0339 family)